MFPFSKTFQYKTSKVTFTQTMCSKYQMNGKKTPLQRFGRMWNSSIKYFMTGTAHMFLQVKKTLFALIKTLHFLKTVLLTR